MSGLLNLVFSLAMLGMAGASFYYGKVGEASTWLGNFPEVSYLLPALGD